MFALLSSVQQSRPPTTMPPTTTVSSTSLSTNNTTQSSTSHTITGAHALTVPSTLSLCTLSNTLFFDTPATPNFPNTTSQPPYVPTWSANTHPVTVTPFTSSVGPTFQVEDSPKDVFQHFLPDQSLNMYVLKQIYIRNKPWNQPSTWLEWKRVNVTELKAYIGFSVRMGLVNLPAIEDNWKVDPYFHYVPRADWISMQRFRDISRNIHFVDNTKLVAHGQPGSDKLGKCSQSLSTVAGCLKKAIVPTVSVQLMRL